jgi:hypothetical protein
VPRKKLHFSDILFVRYLRFSDLVGFSKKIFRILDLWSKIFFYFIFSLNHLFLVYHCLRVRISYFYYCWLFGSLVFLAKNYRFFVFFTFLWFFLQFMGKLIFASDSVSNFEENRNFHDPYHIIILIIELIDSSVNLLKLSIILSYILCRKQSNRALC